MKIRKIIISLCLVCIMGIPVLSFAETADQDTIANKKIGSLISDTSIIGLEETENILLDKMNQNTVQLKSTAITYTWKIESKSLVSDSYPGKYKIFDQITVSKADAPMDIAVSIMRSSSHSVSGSLMVSYSVLNAQLGFDVRKTVDSKIACKKLNASAGTWYCKARPIYKRYKIVQRQYRVGGGSSGVPMNNTKTIYVNKFSHFDSSLTKTK